MQMEKTAGALGHDGTRLWTAGEKAMADAPAQAGSIRGSGTRQTVIHKETNAQPIGGSLLESSIPIAERGQRRGKFFEA